jgi:hypothetical protein
MVARLNHNRIEPIHRKPQPERNHSITYCYYSWTITFPSLSVKK